jgi:hypothetical protein
VQSQQSSISILQFFVSFSIEYKEGVALVLYLYPKASQIHRMHTPSHCHALSEKIDNDHKVTFIVKKLGSLTKIVFMAREYLHSVFVLLSYIATHSQRKQSIKTRVLLDFNFLKIFMLNFLFLNNLLYFFKHANDNATHSKVRVFL